MPLVKLPSVKSQIAEDRRSEQGVWLLLASLGVFFFSSIILYAIYVVLRIAPEAGEVMPFYMPRSFLFTTVTMVAVSILLHMAVAAVRSERQGDFHRYIVLSFVLAIVFFLLQGTGLAFMVNEMLKPSKTMQNLYGLTFFLVVVHALHVVGGVAGLTMLMFGIARKKYDHERYFPVRFCAMYWHFLDVVWIMMLGSFALAAAVTNA